MDDDNENVEICFKVPKAILAFVMNYCAFAQTDRNAYLREALITGVEADACAISGPNLDQKTLIEKYGLADIFK